MKSLRFESLSLISMIERSAAKFNFHPRLTLVTGSNHTGKSSLIKSLYWTLGAEPADVHPSWENLNLTSILKVLVDGRREFYFVRQGKSFQVYDEHKECLLQTTHVTKELGPFIAKLFGVELQLVTHDGDMVVPPPAYIYLPFYIDQDKGWQDAWSSFANLGHFARWQQDVVKFHTGQRTNEYYGLQSEKSRLGRTVNVLSAELDASRRAYAKLVSRVGALPLAFDREAYQRSLDVILADMSEVQSRRELLTLRQADLENARISLEQQIDIAKLALSEVEKDYRFASRIDRSEVRCPTCGVTHENSFRNKFSLVETVEDYRAFLVSANIEKGEYAKKRDELSGEVSVLDARINELNGYMKEKHGTLRLADILTSEGDKRAREVLQNQLQDYIQEIGSLEIAKTEVEKNIKLLSDPKRAKEISGFFHDLYATYLKDLSVHMLDVGKDSVIPTRVKDTGSEQPRAVLAYYAAILRTLASFSSTPLLPVVVDSPLQQEQDDENSTRILQFIAKWECQDAQVILGTVSDFGVQFPGETIELTEPYRLLSKNDYASIVEELKMFGWNF